MTETTDRADNDVNPHDSVQRDRLVGEMYRRLSTARNYWGHPLVGADELAALGSLLAALTDAERELAKAWKGGWLTGSAYGYWVERGQEDKDIQDLALAANPYDPNA